MHIKNFKTVDVKAIVVLGGGVDQETGLQVDSMSAARIKCGSHELLRARMTGDGVVILAPGKPPMGKAWRSPNTFAEIMATNLRQRVRDLAVEEIIINEHDDDIWTTWNEISWAVDVAKEWYRQHYERQMVSWNDYTHLQLVFVSDQNHVRFRIPLMVRMKLGHGGIPPYDDRFLPEEGMKQVFWATDPSWTTTAADHKPTPLWYEFLATVKFLYIYWRRRR